MALDDPAIHGSMLTMNSIKIGNGYDHRYNNHSNRQSVYSSHMGGYYGSRQQLNRPEPPNSYYHDGYGAGPSMPPPRSRYGQRMNSEPALARYHGPPNGSGAGGVYPTHNYHQSYDTVNTGFSNGSDTTGPWANSTDPSSENSSIDKGSSGKQQQQHQQQQQQHPLPPEPQETYGIGFGSAPPFKGPILEEYGTGSHGSSHPQFQDFAGGRMPGQNNRIPLQSYGDAPPQVPPKAGPAPGMRGKLSKMNHGGGTDMYSGVPVANGGRSALQHQNSEKRKSWFKRRFSKD
jgi:hypothetical protein